MRDDINQLTNIIKNYIHPPKTFLEIGSYNGADTVTIANYWKIDPQRCYIVEANPRAYYTIKATLPDYNCYNFAASDKSGLATFRRAVHPSELVLGISSLLYSKLKYEVENISVETRRMDSFLKDLNKKIDLVKIDAEGCSYEVLVGFGQMIETIDAIQVETERFEFWYNQKLHAEVHDYLTAKNFTIVEQKIDSKGAQYECLYVNNARQLL